MYTSTHASAAIREQPELVWSASFKKDIKIKEGEINEEVKLTVNIYYQHDFS